MGERAYYVGGKRIMFSERDDLLGCLCTFPHNDIIDGKLVINRERLINLALLGCAVVALTDKSIEEDIYLPYGLENYLEAITNFVEALIKETEQRIIKEFEIIHKAGWFVEDTDFEDDIIPLIKGVE